MNTYTEYQEKIIGKLRADNIENLEVNELIRVLGNTVCFTKNMNEVHKMINKGFTMKDVYPKGYYQTF